MDKTTLKDLFVTKNGLLTEAAFEEAIETSEKLHRPLEQVLLDEAFVSPAYYLTILSEYFNLPATDLKIQSVELETLKKLPESFSRENDVVVFGEENGTYQVAVANPVDEKLRRLVERTLDKGIEFFITRSTDIRRAQILYQGSVDEILQATAPDIEGKDEVSSENQIPDSVVQYTEALIRAAVAVGASDIHIEPFAHETYIRFRIDGVLKVIAKLSPKVHRPLIAHLKVLSALRLDEHRVPQDGRLQMKVAEQEVDIRISVVPSHWGEKAVMRVLPQGNLLFDIEHIGLLKKDQELLKRELAKPHGLILLCGPTGSGKTTTLYSFLQEIGSEKIDVINISTVEDPIEYTIPRVTQMQIDPENGLSFSTGLKSLLRQDPDILMVGEIRDAETADIAVRAALTGRLMFSSLHTMTASGALPRLLDLGVEPFLIASTVNAVVSQRLVRKLCPHCRESYTLEKEAAAKLASLYDMKQIMQILHKHEVISKVKPLDSLRFYRSPGCGKCGGEGYVGRMGIFEILQMDEGTRQSVHDHDDARRIEEKAVQAGMKTLAADAFAKALLGETSIEEVISKAL